MRGGGGNIVGCGGLSSLFPFFCCSRILVNICGEGRGAERGEKGDQNKEEKKGPFFSFSPPLH